MAAIPNPPPTLRSCTPPPQTYNLRDVRKINVVKARLSNALHTGGTLLLLREQLVNLLSDLSELPAGGKLEPTPDDHEAPTERNPAPFNDEQPPSTDIASDEGREYGGG